MTCIPVRGHSLTGHAHPISGAAEGARGYFGFNHKVTLHPSYSMNTKGGCINDDFLDWIDKSVGEQLLSQYKY